MTKLHREEEGGGGRKTITKGMLWGWTTRYLAREEGTYEHGKIACKTGTPPPVDRPEDGFLAVMLYCSYARCYCRGELSKGCVGSLCAISCKCIRIYDSRKKFC